MKRFTNLLFIMALPILLLGAKGNDKDKLAKNDTLQESTFGALSFRGIGPAFASGRIADFAINPKNNSEYYVAVAAGNVWKTTNSGTTWNPIFDNYGAWSIADVEIDPCNTNVVWVGTGEYNSQRAIGYGDGVYKSCDGGRSFTNMGLKNSEHIGRVIIDPRNGNVVYVAAQGPLWGPGGERGLYKTADGGKTWTKSLDISENTGVTDIVFDPRNPDVLYAASYQRRRHVWTLVDGGPEGAIYKSTDAGATWKKLTSGLPGGDVGRIGLAISPVNPDYIYAIIEAEGETGGFFRTTNRGATWEKMSNHVAGSPQYYNRIFCDPADVNKVYTVETITQYTLDGGKTFKSLGNNNRHVDDHALWIDPTDTQHLLIGGDGGIYETFDAGQHWDLKENLPVTQFYRVSVDNSYPYYYVYGGTQDNNSMGGPSRTTKNATLTDDWFVTNGGDGFETAIDPIDQNIVYAQSQHGGLVRYDRKSGEAIDIQPQPPVGEAYRWNWNSPIIVSPHHPHRLYFAANKLFMSDDRGDTWQLVSPDLTRQLDRNKLQVFGKIQPPEAVAKNASTSFYGNIVALDESPLKEGLLYVGTDDGLIQVSSDAGKNWKKYESFTGIPEKTYVDFLLASQHDENVVYAAFDARKQNNLKPYLLKSTDKGNTWTSIVNNLPQRGTVYCIAEDHKNKDLLFIGTEFGVYFTTDGGKIWVKLSNGLPTTCVMDMSIQKREDDLVIATFGRGFYILEDYSILRGLKTSTLDSKNILFPVKDALAYVQTGTKYGQGSTTYTNDNPPVAATFTWYLKDVPKSLKAKRKEAEKEASKNKKDIDYPAIENLLLEEKEEKPVLLFTITNEQGEIVRRISTQASTGINRTTWDLRFASTFPVTGSGDPFESSGSAMLVPPGKYGVSMAMVHHDSITPLQGPVWFTVKALNNATLAASDKEAQADFYKKVFETGRVVFGAFSLADDMETRIKAVRLAIEQTPSMPFEFVIKAKALQQQLNQIQVAFKGNPSLEKRNENQPPSIANRIYSLVYSHWSNTSAPTNTMKTDYDLVNKEFGPLYLKLKNLINTDLKQLESEMEKHGAPYTPGRFPELK